MHRALSWLILGLLAAALLAPRAAAEEEAALEPLARAVAAYRMGDYRAAIELLEPLARSGDSEAQYRLGFMSMQGLGMPPDDAEAAVWFERAALRGHAQAQNYLGLLLFEGRGVPRDFERAFVFFEMAAAAGHEDAANNRLIVARKMTSEQIARAQREAGRLIGTLAAEPEPVAEVPLALAGGVVVGAGGHVITRAAAVAGCTDLRVRQHERVQPGKVTAVDAFNGLAVIAVPTPLRTGARLRERPIGAGEPVTIQGYELDQKRAVVPVSVQGTVRDSPALERVDARYLQLGAPVAPSHLGAPVFDAQGSLVGIVATDVAPDSAARVVGEVAADSGLALRQRLVRLMLHRQGIAFATGGAQAAGAAGAGGDLTGALAVAVECWAREESERHG